MRERVIMRGIAPKKRAKTTKKMAFLPYFYATHSNYVTHRIKKPPCKFCLQGGFLLG
jgi:hypothetical protein